MLSLPRSSLFVTASGTEIGKTFVAAGLSRALRELGREVTAIKPVMSGFDANQPEASDAGLLLAATGRQVTRESIGAIAPWRFALPISPDMAAVRAGTDINFAALLQFCRNARDMSADVLLIEAAGGVMAPVTANRTMLDWAEALGVPALLVGGTYLGAISHALTAHLALASRSVPVACLVLSESEASPVPPEETRAALARHLPATSVVLVRRGPEANADLRALARSLAASGGER